jgi:hypothetical protein
MKQQPPKPSLLPDFGPKGAPLHLTNPTTNHHQINHYRFSLHIPNEQNHYFGSTPILKNELKIAGKKKRYFIILNTAQTPTNRPWEKTIGFIHTEREP